MTKCFLRQQFFDSYASFFAEYLRTSFRKTDFANKIFSPYLTPARNTRRCGSTACAIGDKIKLHLFQLFLFFVTSVWLQSDLTSVSHIWPWGSKFCPEGSLVSSHLWGWWPPHGNSETCWGWTVQALLELSMAIIWSSESGRSCFVEIILGNSSARLPVLGLILTWAGTGLGNKWGHKNWVLVRISLACSRNICCVHTSSSKLVHLSACNLILPLYV